MIQTKKIKLNIKKPKSRKSLVIIEKKHMLLATKGLQYIYNYNLLFDRKQQVNKTSFNFFIHTYQYGFLTIQQIEYNSSSYKTLLLI